MLECDKCEGAYYNLLVLLGIHLTLMFFALLHKDLFKGMESLGKGFLKQIIVTLVTQGLPSSFLFRLVA